MKPANGFAPVVILIVAALVIGISATLSYQKLKTKSSPSPSPAAISQSPTPDDSSSETSVKEDETTNWKTYVNTKHKFSLRFPAEKFSVSFENIDNEAVNIKSPDYSSPPSLEQFFYIIQIQVFNSDNKSIETWVEEYINGSGADKKYIKKENINISGINGQKVMGLPNKEETLDVFLRREGKIYNLKFHPYAKGSPYPYQEEYIKFFDQILSTFRFLD